jgi:hypothetical protein
MPKRSSSTFKNRNDDANGKQQDVSNMDLHV